MAADALPPAMRYAPPMPALMAIGADELLAWDWVLAVAGACLLLLALGRRATGTLRVLHEAGPSNTFQEDSLLIPVMVYFISALGLAALTRAAWPGGKPILAEWAAGNGAQLCGGAACLWVAGRQFTGGVIRFLAGPVKARGAQNVWLILGVVVVAVGICPLIRDLTVWVILGLFPGYCFEAHPTLDALHTQELSLGIVAALWIGAALIAPLTEEMFFRGIMQNLVVSASGRPGLAIALSSAAFGVVHFSQIQAVPALVFLGALLGWSYFRTHSLLIPMVIHSMFNLKTLVWDAMGA